MGAGAPTQGARPIDPRSRKDALKRLRWPLGLTRAGLVAERVTHAFWPLWSLAFVVLAALMLGAHERVAVEISWGIGGIALILGFAFLVRGALRFRWPRRTEVLARLDATMPGRPIQAMLDAQAIGAEDDASRAVWAAHQARMRARSESARAVPPDLRVSSRDRFGLRYMALLAFVVALLFGSLWRVGTVAELAPGAGAAQAAAGPAWEGWLEPPAYTGLPVLYLGDQPEGALDAPKGSRITLRLYGDTAAFDISQSVSEAPTAPERANADSAAQPPDITVTRSGHLAIEGEGGRRWEIAMIPDAAPEIEATGPAEASAVGAFTMPFAARDDYEVLEGRARIELDLARIDRRHGLGPDPEPRAAIELPLPMPVARDRQEFEDVLIEDFSEHPWANLPVKITLSAIDAAANEGISPVIETELAARHFFDPLAAAVIEQRRDLLWNRANAGRIAQILRAVSHRPDGVFKHETTYLRLRVILRRIESMAAYGMTDAQQAEIAEALWELALQLEEGTLADALERMRQAQERLSEAMKNGASDAEIARLMDELREATRDYMDQLSREFAQQNRGNQSDQPDQGQRDENAMTMNMDDIQRMMDRIQELMEQGRMAEAQQALEEFQQMMENMRITEGQGGQGQSPGQQALEGLGETLREQQGLSDQAFRDLQEQFNPNSDAGQSQGNEGRSGGLGRGQSHEGQGQGQGQGDGQQPGQGQGQGQRDGQPGQGGDGTAQDLGQSLADRQSALRQQLDQQRRALPGAGTEGGDAARDALDRAGRAMDGAEDALRRDDLADAIDKQAEAMENLREGMRNLGEALAEQGQRQPGQGESPDNLAGGRRADPLGRNMRGAPGVDDNMLQGEDVYRRARDLLDEIRRRSGEQTRPEPERNYLERLLDRF
ncbi:TIGR02302 family protein [Marimonas arenosa]|uniref:TIGR02302 family protein n=1 Tax=Marimonas arenosa TaxID=1795305 RepID=A0AAE4B6F3_9RHOB|nr:TIGR02302 family protein [Marimonas arenosa]MDQ2092077.1 TIGR02302 family protein [Marimonas arenosa]